LTAALDTRANRRANEYLEKGSEVLVDDIKINLSKRDKIDSSRNDSPLTKASDAIEVDTTNITIDEQVNLILEVVKKIANKKTIN
jgi:CMP/dCMP kinase